jgi:hypothetical protein
MNTPVIDNWVVDGPTTLHGYDDDLVYMRIQTATNDPELQREVALVSAWDLEGERYAQMIAALPKMLAACQAVVDRWERGDLAEAARICQAAVDSAVRHGDGSLTMTKQSQPRRAAARTIRLPCHGITIRLHRENANEAPASGMITSNLKASGHTAVEQLFNAAVDGLESLILAHACAGVDVASPAYIEGIETAVDAIANHLA